MNYWERNKEIIKKISEELGEQDIYEFLNQTDFFVEPGSSKFHHARRGGLAEHSLGVYFNFLKLCEAFDICDKNFAFRVSMLHDLCKIGTYEGDGHGGFNKKSFPEPVLGHGDSSIFLAMKGGIKLSNEEIACIKWHMGCQSTYYEDLNRYNQIKKTYIRLSLFQNADFLGSKFENLSNKEYVKYWDYVIEEMRNKKNQL